MRRYEYPNIKEQNSPAVQIEEIKHYLHNLVDLLNFNQEGISAFCIFKEILSALKEAEMPEDSQITPMTKQLGAVAVAFVAEVLNSKKSYFIENSGEFEQTGILNAQGSTFFIGELAAKVQRLENEIRIMKGE